MSLAADVEVMPTRIDLAAWDAEVGLRDDAYELVEGVPTMAPPENVDNRTAGVELAFALRSGGVPAAFGTDVEVTISEVPATVRVPDVVVFDRSVVGDKRRRLMPEHVFLVVEVVSPSSVERDLVAKRRDYAAAGIPAYLIVDLRDGRNELTLYTARDEQGRFVDVDPVPTVTVEIGGVAVEISAASLLA